MREKILEVFKSKHVRKRMLLFVVVLMVGVIAILPRSFAVESQAVKSVIVSSEKLDFDNKNEGAWSITESVAWTNKGEAKITFDLETIFRNNLEGTDFIFALDSSSVLVGEKLDEIKSSIKEFSNNLLNNPSNKISLISFNSAANNLVDFTDNKDLIREKVDSLSATGGTNYYNALAEINEVLKNYQVEKERDCIVVFITGSYPNEGTPNQNTYFKYLKEEYPNVIFNAVQYELGDSVLEQVKSISDYQYIATKNNLSSRLVKFLNVSEVYDEFTISEYIDERYFNVNDIKDINVNKGNIDFNKSDQKITWNIDSLKSGLGAKMEVTVKLKNEFLSQYELYSVSKRLEVNSLIGEDREEVSSVVTPVLSNNHKVIYDVNAPNGCSPSNVPSSVNKAAFEIVNISDLKPRCRGYQFKGWKIVSSKIKKINDSYFTMPDDDVIIRAEWSKIQVNLKMDGKIYKEISLYDQVKLDYQNGKAMKYSGELDTDVGTDDIYYYKGEVNNNNVIFANYCWKMYRTTDTGGVKIIYNGVPTNGTCNNIGEDSKLTATQMNTSSDYVKFNEKSASLSDSGYMYNKRYGSKYKSAPKNFKAGNSVSFNSSTGTYTLTGTTSTVSSNWATSYSSLSNTHYTCWDMTGKCSTISYIFYTADYGAYYIELDSGVTVENALDDMLYSTAINKINSNIKNAIDNWYSKNMVNYTKYLEDTIWCNDRRMSPAYPNGWNPSGKSIIDQFKFMISQNNSALLCPVQNDRFTVNNAIGNKALTYPVGLITRQEYILTYSSGKSPLISGVSYWTLTPNHYTSVTYQYQASTNDNFTNYNTVDVTGRVRPSVSLKAGIKYGDGNGSVQKPYIISVE